MSEHSRTKRGAMAKPAVAASPAIQMATRKNPYEAYRDAATSAKQIVDTLKSLFSSSDRHGDLHAIRSAARRIEADVTVMIEIEEE